jgi:hypothetical protein
MGDAGGGRDEISARRVEIAMAGGMAPIDGRWHAAQVGTLLGRRRDAQAAEPTRGALQARRSGAGLGSPQARAIRLPPGLHEAGGEHRPRGEIVGDGAPGLGTVAAAHVPGGRQPLADDPLHAHLSGFAPRRSPQTPAWAEAWGTQARGAWRTDRVGEVLRALQRLRPWQ